MASGQTTTWKRPYPLSTDAPAVHTDIEALANSLDVWPLYPTTATSSRTGVAGESALCSPSVVYTLPSSPATGDAMRIVAGASATGATAVEVLAAGGKVINGIGLAGASSFLLGTPSAHATLQYDGTNWRILDGGQDTGWVSLTTMPSGTSTVTPAARLRGDQVQCRGDLTVTGGAGGSGIGSLPNSTMYPSATRRGLVISYFHSSSYVSAPLEVFGSSGAGGIDLMVTTTAVSDVLLYDGIAFSI